MFVGVGIPKSNGRYFLVTSRACCAKYNNPFWRLMNLPGVVASSGVSTYTPLIVAILSSCLAFLSISETKKRTNEVL